MTAMRIRRGRRDGGGGGPAPFFDRSRRAGGDFGGAEDTVSAPFENGGAINSAARVAPLHGGSRGFESLIAHHAVRSGSLSRNRAAQYHGSGMAEQASRALSKLRR